MKSPSPQELRNMATNMVEVPDFRFMPSHLKEFARGVLSLLDRIEELEKPLDGTRDCGCPCGECRYGHDR